MKRRAKRAQAARLSRIVEQMPEPEIVETEPGKFDVRFQFPPNISETDAQAIVSGFLAEVQREYPGDLRAVDHAGQRPAHLDGEPCTCPVCLTP